MMVHAVSKVTSGSDTGVPASELLGAATGTAQAAAMAVRLAGALAERRAEWQALSVEATMTIVAATRSDGCRNTTARRGMT